MPNLGDSVEQCIRGLSEKFIKNPYNFFTESDAHAYLYYYIFRSGPRELKVRYRTKDGNQTVLIHREYPTNFRYSKKDMQRYEDSQRLGARGHYDLVVLNPEFVEGHNLEEIIAKEYTKVQKSEKKHVVAAIEFKLITKPLDINMKSEIHKDVIKLTWAIELGQAEDSYMIIFNRGGKEKDFSKELKGYADENPRVKIIYLESVKAGKRHYRPVYYNDWKYKLRYKESKT